MRSMGRDTTGVKGMNVSAKVNGVQNRVLAMDIARDDSELFVVTENGYGKRTQVSEYPVKGRGTKGVLTAKLTEKKGGLAGALIVREHQDLLFISQNGMVQRTRAGGISQMGRPTQGVKVMNMKDDDIVSAVALVVDSDGPDEVGPPPPELPTNEPTAEEGDTIPEDEHGDGATTPTGAQSPPKLPTKPATPRLQTPSPNQLHGVRQRYSPSGHIGGTAPLIQTLKSGSRRSSG